MAQEVNSTVMIYLATVVYVATPSTDLTTMLVRRIAELTGEVTGRVKSVIVSAGASN